MDWQKDENLVYLCHQYNLFAKDFFSILIFMVDMAFTMSNIDDFDNNQIS